MGCTVEKTRWHAMTSMSSAEERPEVCSWTFLTLSDGTWKKYRIQAISENFDLPKRIRHVKAEVLFSQKDCRHGDGASKLRNRDS